MIRALAVTALVVAATGCSTTRGGHTGVDMADTYERADSLFAVGDYAAAAEAYEAWLARDADARDADVVLLRLAALYLVMGTPQREPARGEAALRRLVEGYPSSPLRKPAEYILSLRRRIEKLEGTVSRARSRAAELERRLEELKRIDLERPN